MTDFPEHDRVERLAAERIMLNEFLNWLGGQGVFLMHHDLDTRATRDVAAAEHAALAAKFLGIDEARLAAERAAMLDALHELHAPRCA